MVNSAVPRYSNSWAELHRNYLFKFKLVLSSVWSNTHMMASLCERITDLSLFNSSSEYSGIVQLQSALNDDYHIVSGKIKHLPYFRANNKKIFFQNLYQLFVHFRAVSLTHSALQWNAATLRKVLAPFRWVMWSILVLFLSLLSLFSFFPFNSSFF